MTVVLTKRKTAGADQHRESAMGSMEVPHHRAGAPRSRERSLEQALPSRSEGAPPCPYLDLGLLLSRL